ncbi:MAG TPA: GNAT family N-acetyltransferase [Solirubrobacteraceae bacterium]|nr:GNAT family N-acetyltransferase [Solirubrobacteraceae bacterium]
MLAVTLDTSCALNFLGLDETADDALIDLVAAAIAGRVDVCVTEQAYEEVRRNPREDERAQRLARLRTFGRVGLAAHRTAERDRLAGELLRALFPDAEAGSRTDSHNRRDCLQLATHALVGRDVFCTLDGKLLKRAASAAARGIEVLGPEAALALVEEERAGAAAVGVSALAVRDVEVDRDEGAIREVLAPLADDYPDFGGWLNGALTKAERGEVSIRVGVLSECVGAVALSTRKDERVVKLSAFYVTERARDAGLGQHLLWSELRGWVAGGVEKVYVTVSSRHAELIGFFRAFGFLIEGVSPRRYQDDTAEIVLGKHLIRRVVDDGALSAFAQEVAARVFAAPGGLSADGGTWALAPLDAHPAFSWSGEGASLRLVARASAGTAERQWGLLDLERAFHPLRLGVSERRALLVPIQPQWAEAMLDYPTRQPSLFETSPEKLLLRADNAYYCYPRLLDVAVPGAPILFYVSGGRGIVGEARIIQAQVAAPEELFARFGGLGIYGIHEIRAHVQTRGERAGQALALRFGSYVPFAAPVSIGAMRKALGRGIQPQSLTPLSGEDFELLRRTGGLEW